MCSIMNAVRTSGGLRERLFNAAYNAKKQAILSGNFYQSCSIRFILVFRLSRLFFFVFEPYMHCVWHSSYLTWLLLSNNFL
jgi:hypothetical protein